MPYRGRGAQATVAGRAFQVGDPRFLEQEQLTLPESLADKTLTWWSASCQACSAIVPDM